MFSVEALLHLRDRRGDKALHQVGAGARIGGRDRDRRFLDLRIFANGQVHETLGAKQNDHQCYNRREDWTANEYLGKIHFFGSPASVVLGWVNARLLDLDRSAGAQAVLTCGYNYIALFQALGDFNHQSRATAGRNEDLSYDKLLLSSRPQPALLRLQVLLRPDFVPAVCRSRAFSWLFWSRTNNKHIVAIQAGNERGLRQASQTFIFPRKRNANLGELAGQRSFPSGLLPPSHERRYKPGRRVDAGLNGGDYALEAHVTVGQARA